MPVPAPTEQVRADLATVEAALTPVDAKVAAALLAQTIEIFGVPRNWNRIAGFYLEALEDVPADLAALAMKRVRLGCKFFPKPAEIRGQVGDEMARRHLARSRLRFALWKREKEARNG